MGVESQALTSNVYQLQIFDTQQARGSPNHVCPLLTRTINGQASVIDVQSQRLKPEQTRILARMSRSVTITYELNPPKDTPADGLSASKTHELPIPDNDGSSRAYYEGLRDALAKGKDVIGEELTAWRDAVGNGEKTKESAAPSKVADEEEDDEEEEE